VQMLFNLARVRYNPTAHISPPQNTGLPVPPEAAQMLPDLQSSKPAEKVRPPETTVPEPEHTPVKAAEPEKPAQESAAPTPAVPERHTPAILSGPMTLRKAVILSEILDKPRALRRRK